MMIGAGGENDGFIDNCHLQASASTCDLHIISKYFKPTIVRRVVLRKNSLNIVRFISPNHVHYVLDTRRYGFILCIPNRLDWPIMRHFWENLWLAFEWHYVSSIAICRYSSGIDKKRLPAYNPVRRNNPLNDFQLMRPRFIRLRSNTDVKLRTRSRGGGNVPKPALLSSISDVFFTFCTHFSKHNYVGFTYFELLVKSGDWNIRLHTVNLWYWELVLVE